MREGGSDAGAESVVDAGGGGGADVLLREVAVGCGVAGGWGDSH